VTVTQITRLKPVCTHLPKTNSSLVPSEPSYSCSVCGSEITDAQAMIDGVCSNLNCKLTYAEHWQLENAKQHQQRDSAIQSWLAELLDNHPHSPYLDKDESQQPLFFNTPVNNKKLEPVPESLVRLFLFQLAELLEAAQNTHLPAIPSIIEPYIATATTEAFMNNACRTCKGNCCTTANPQAFLDEDSLKDILEQTLMTSAELVQLYKDYIPAEHYHGSCLFHTAVGCALPVSLRSQTCNRFMCKELMNIKHYADVAKPSVMITAAVGDNAVYRISLHSASEYKLITENRKSLTQLNQMMEE